MSEKLESLVTKARNALSSTSALVSDDKNAKPRYELFHAPNSICAQKVRTVLAYHNIPYVSDELNLFQGETYLPEYVRLRMVGCEAQGGRMATHHSGSTSTEAGGCDGAVVPTLIDWQQDSVIVDSKRICLYLDEQSPGHARLCPDSITGVMDQITIVDNIPNYQMLMDRKPNPSETPETNSSTGNRFSTLKVGWCDQYLREFSDDPVLFKAYWSKRAKELSAAKTLFSADAMGAAYAKIEDALQILEEQLKEHDGRWIFGNVVTMADLFWAIELLRMDNMGLKNLWLDRLPETTRFLASAANLPCIRSAVLDWPGAIF